VKDEDDDLLEVGDSVQINTGHPLSVGRGGVSDDEVGTLMGKDRFNDLVYLVKFPSHTHWQGRRGDIVRVSFVKKSSDLGSIRARVLSRLLLV
jgi:hypothetical protein